MIQSSGQYRQHISGVLGGVLYSDGGKCITRLGGTGTEKGRASQCYLVSASVAKAFGMLNRACLVSMLVPIAQRSPKLSIVQLASAESAGGRSLRRHLESLPWNVSVRFLQISLGNTD